MRVKALPGILPLAVQEPMMDSQHTNQLEQKEGDVQFSEGTGIEVGPVRPDEVATVAQLHFEFFGPEAAGRSVANLGPQFLEQIFYRLNLENPYFFCDVARHEGQVIGISVYTTRRRKLVRYMLCHQLIRVAWTTLKLICRSWSLFTLVLSNIRFVGSESLPSNRPAEGWWLVLCVQPEYRSKEFKERTGVSVANLLIDLMERAMQQHGCDCWSGMAPVDKGAINNLLKRHGARPVGTIRAQGLEMWHYLKELGPEAATSEEQGATSEE